MTAKDKGEQTGLSTGNDIVSLEDGRQTVGLDRGRRRVKAELDVLEHDWVETSLVELWRSDGRKDTSASRHTLRTGSM